MGTIFFRMVRKPYLCPEMAPKGAGQTSNLYSPSLSTGTSRPGVARVLAVRQTGSTISTTPAREERTPVIIIGLKCQFSICASDGGLL